MKLVIFWKNHKPFQIEIEPSNTILELKKKIAAYYSGTYTGFNVLNGTDIIGSDKENCSISSCGISRLIRLPDNFKPGLKQKLNI